MAAGPLEALSAKLTSRRICDSDDVARLQSLLFPEARIPKRSHSVAATARPAAKRPPAHSRTKSTVKAGPPPDHESLECVDIPSRRRLATEAVNYSLDLLGRMLSSIGAERPDAKAAEVTGQSRGQRSSPPSARRKLPGSGSQSESIDVAAAPAEQQESMADLGCVAFYFLQSPEALNSDGLESLIGGSLAFCARLLGLGLDRIAVPQLKRLNILLQTLQHPSADGKSTNGSFAQPSHRDTADTSAKSLECLLDMRKINCKSAARLEQVSNYQMLVLRLLVKKADCSTFQAILPRLDYSNRVSPLSILLQRARDAATIAQVTSQLDSLAKLLSHCAKRLGRDTPHQPANAATALRLQALGICARMAWMHLARHEKSPQQDLASSFVSAASIYLSSTRDDASQKLSLVRSIHRELDVFQSQHGSRSDTRLAQSPKARLLLASICFDVGDVEEARDVIEDIFSDIKDSEADDCDALHLLAVSRLGRTAFDSDLDPEESDEAWQYLNRAAKILQKPFRLGDIAFDHIIRECLQLRNEAYGFMQRITKTTPASNSNSCGKYLACFDVVNSFSSMLLRYLAQISKDGPLVGSKSAESRSSLLCRIAKQSLEAASSMTRLGLRQGMLSTSHVASALDNCSQMIERLRRIYEHGKTEEKTDSTTLDSLAIDVSKLHFQSAKSGHEPGDDVSEAVKMIQHGLHLCKHLNQASRRAAQAYLGYYRLGRLLLRLSKDRIAFDTFCLGLAEFVAAGFVAEAAVAAETMPVKNVLRSSTEMQIFQSLNKDILDLEISGKHQFDDSLLNTLDEKAKLFCLETRMTILSKGKSKHVAKTNSRRLASDTLHKMLLCYDASAYPLRWLLTMIAALQSGSDTGVAVEDLDAMRLRIADENLDLGEDFGLAQYQSDILARSKLAVGLYQPLQNYTSILEAIDSWSDLICQYGTWDKIVLHIFDMETWLAELEIAADCLDMLGYDQHRICCLAMIALILAHREECQKDRYTGSLANVARSLFRSGCIHHAKAWMNAAKMQSDSEFVRTQPNICVDLALGAMNVATQQDSLDADHFPRVARKLENASQSTAGYLAGFDAIQLPYQAQLVVATSELYSQCSISGIQKGDLLDALLFARRAVTLLVHVWRLVESNFGLEADDMDATLAAVDELARSLSRMSISPRKERTEFIQIPPVPGPIFWALSRRLFDALMYLCFVSRQVGSLASAMSACEQAQKVADSTDAPALQARACIEKARLLWCAGRDEEAKVLLHQAEKLYEDNPEHIVGNISLMLAVGEFHRHRRHWRHEMDAYNRADIMVEELAEKHDLDSVGIILSLLAKDLTLEKKRNIPQEKETKVNGEVTSTTEPHKRGRKREVVVQKRAESPVPSQVMLEEQPQLDAIRQAIMIHRAESMLAQGNLMAATKLLQPLEEEHMEKNNSLLLAILQASLLHQEALASMAAHAVYSMLPESTLSFPSVFALNIQETAGNLLKEKNDSRARHRRNASRPSLSGHEDISMKLTSAKETLKSVVSVSDGLSNIVLARAREVLAACSAMLSFAGPCPQQIKAQPRDLAWQLDSVQSTITLREHLVVEVEKENKSAGTALSWPERDELASSLTRLSMSNAEQKLMDLLPEDWVVVSLNIREGNEHLYLTRYVAQKEPFVLRLPLNRQTGDDLDEESFSLEQAQDELMNIIQSSDQMVHKARDSPQEMKVKGAKTQWWAERDELDARLKSLLANMENIWFGGFRSLFSAHHGSTTALKKFKDCFEAILGRHLPSRQSGGLGNNLQQISLDSTVFELFTGLMTSSDDDVAELDEILNDLLYFVVDILQYNGEVNAYDEIDFDAIIVEVQDALLDFRDSLANASSSGAKKKPIILVLDKKLHMFPWESIPCLYGRAVSRVPSIKDIIDRIQLMKKQRSAEGIRVSPYKGTYMLNPGNDLAATQKHFESPLLALTKSGWTTHVGKALSEEDFAAALSQEVSETNRGLLVYIGHGSGAQYVRAKTIRRMRPLCNVALLLGCSSARLKDAGEFESHGTPKTYLAAGAPAVLGSLWDVTDGDIDKFSSAMLMNWGLLPRGSFEEDQQQRQKGKSKAQRKANSGAARSSKREPVESVSLSEAVAQGREHCYLKYLNGAAMVVYGVPVYLG